MTRTVVAIALAGALGGGAASAAPLKVRPGLWEVSSIVQRGKPTLPTNIDQLPPDQKAAIIDKLSAIYRTRKTAYACVTKAEVESGTAFTSGTQHPGCSSTPVVRTASESVTTLECGGGLPAKGEVRLVTKDPKHVAGTVTLEALNGRRQLDTQSWLTATWLTDDCKANPAAATAAKEK